MSLVFDGMSYDTIADVKKRFPIAEKTLVKMIDEGAVPEPEVVTYGTRTFRHFSKDWQEKLADKVKPRNGK